jgi:hypothetical protein
MLVALAAMASLQVLPTWSVTKGFWTKHVGFEIFWPWFTLIGATITLVVAWLVRRWIPTRAKPVPEDQAKTPAAAE